MTPDGSLDLAGVVDSWLDEHGEDLIALRRNLHAHPELSGREFATTELIAERLELAGLEPRRRSCGTGLICDIGEVSRNVGRFAVRADIDALGMPDEKTVAYRSQVEGVCHACGHDVHTTMSLGMALFFAHHRDLLPGPLRCIFQPAEEVVPGGALDVLADDGLADVDAIVALHCSPKREVGQIGTRVGSITSAADMIKITLKGPGGHTARPELTVDMIALAAQVIGELPRRVAEALDEPGDVKLVFGSVHAGDAANVIPATCALEASVRTPSVDTWRALPKLVDRALRELIDPTGASFTLDYVHGVPPVVNDASVTESVRAAARRCLGDDALVEVERSWGGDDFAWYTEGVPGTYVRLGVHDPAAANYLDLHVGRFDVDERAIAVGVKLLVMSAVEHFASARPDR